MKWKIVVDSGCDFKTVENLPEGVSFQNVPLTIQIGSEIFVDDEGLNIDPNDGDIVCHQIISRFKLSQSRCLFTSLPRSRKCHCHDYYRFSLG